MLNKMLIEWDKWSVGAEDNENGWESDYPEWRMLMNEACSVMLINNLCNREIEDLERCFEISSETEDMIDYCKKNFKKTKENLIILSKSSREEVRWQLYEIFKEGDEDSDIILLNSLNNENDNYVLKRALLSLIERRVYIKRTLVLRFMNHKDEMIREIVKSKFVK